MYVAILLILSNLGDLFEHHGCKDSSVQLNGLPKQSHIGTYLNSLNHLCRKTLFFESGIDVAKLIVPFDLQHLI